MRRTRRQQELNEEMAQPRIVPIVTQQPECLLEAMEHISESSFSSHLSNQFLEAVKLPASYLSERLQITELQAVLFSLLMERSDCREIHLSDIADNTGCSTTRILRFSQSLDGLAEKYYVRIRRGDGCDSYRIPREVIVSMRNNEPYERIPKLIQTVDEFFDQYGRLFNEKRAGEISHKMLRNLTEEYLEQIKETRFAKELTLELQDEEERLVFVHMVYLYITQMEEFILFPYLSRLFDDNELPSNIKAELRDVNSDIREHLIENSNIDGMAQPDSYQLTDYAKNELLSEVTMAKTLHTTDRHLTKSETLPEKTLIYNENEAEQIGQLTAILMPERFKQVQENLEKAGMRRGFCCLFYGAPGTGKTETVYQIARQTGRDIMQVNVNAIKSCWVGDSEKNIKRVFDRYRKICDENEPAPILLFNEADAILGLRMEGAIRGVDKMENSIQNIILQEMESLDGIMIATTNLTENLDKAFERRFLYKIRYEKPTLEARSKIWMQMMAGLNEQDARQLASRFDFSGGEIENIVRKHSVSSILSGSNIVDVNALIKTCEQERILTVGHRRVGF